jgi:hypothetical protein
MEQHHWEASNFVSDTDDFLISTQIYMIENCDWSALTLVIIRTHLKLKE